MDVEISGHQFVVGVGFETHSHKLLVLLQKSLYLLRCGGAAALTDAGLAAAASVQGGVQGFGQGADVAAGLRDAVAGALFAGRQGGAQAGGGLAQPYGQPVQPVRVQARHGADGVRIGRGQLRQGRQTAGCTGRSV